MSIEGVIAPKANLFMQISGGASAQLFIREMRAAKVDPAAKSVFIDIDSPGGNVLMIPQAADVVREVAAVKPVVAYSGSRVASAAYWIGAAANAMYIGDSMVQVGSIGVVATHRDTSQADAKAGVKTTEVFAGKYKRIVGLGPLTDEGRATLQAQVDYMYSLFVDAVASHRGVGTDIVLEHMADGRVFIGQQSIDAGLVDGVSTAEALIEQLATNPASFASRRKARVKSVAAPKSTSAGAASEDLPVDGDPAVDPTTTSEGTVMPQADITLVTRESLERDHQALFAQVRSEFLALGATQERDRMKAVREQALPGHEALVERLATDGKTTGPEAAAQVLAAERGARAAATSAHHDDAPKAAKPSPAAGDKGEKTKDEQVVAAKQYAAENKVDFVAAMKALGFAT
ncbi:MAG TPA: S49 family peptidase [Albitalea sp.]|nr:S49 family peptidase [Albitalea sp.]